MHSNFFVGIIVTQKANLTGLLFQFLKYFVLNRSANSQKWLNKYSINLILHSLKLFTACKMKPISKICRYARAYHDVL